MNKIENFIAALYSRAFIPPVGKKHCQRGARPSSYVRSQSMGLVLLNLPRIA